MDFDELSQRYTGAKAAVYNDQRTGSAKWRNEQAAMQSILAGLERGTKLVDVPVGTGRFIPMYKEFAFNLTGIDISRDMLEQASAAASACGLNATFKSGDIRRLPLADEACDAAVCIRFLNWIETPYFQDAVRELARVSRRNVILGVRHLTPLSDVIAGRRGLSRWVRQKLGRAKRNMDKSDLVFHPKSAVTGVFRELGVTVEDSHRIERRSDGTEYWIYRLAKA